MLHCFLYAMSLDMSTSRSQWRWKPVIGWKELSLQARKKINRMWAFPILIYNKRDPSVGHRYISYQILYRSSTGSTNWRGAWWSQGFWAIADAIYNYEGQNVRTDSNLQDCYWKTLTVFPRPPKAHSANASPRRVDLYGFLDKNKPILPRILTATNLCYSFFLLWWTNRTAEWWARTELVHSLESHYSSGSLVCACTYFLSP